MAEPRRNIPKLGLTAMSSHIADLLLVGAGQEQAVRHQRTRSTWHWFFFSFVAFLGWHLAVRVILVPSLGQSDVVRIRFRLIDATLYALLLLLLSLTAYNHYRFMLLPRKNILFRSIAFFYVAYIMLFARFYYSLYGFHSNLFECSNRVVLPSQHFGIQGTQDLLAFLEFVVLSASIMLNTSYSHIQSASLFISCMFLLETAVGYAMIALVLATFVNIIAAWPDMLETPSSLPPATPKASSEAAPLEESGEDSSSL